MIFNQATWNIVGKGYFVRDCTLGFEDNRIGFLFVEDNENKHRDDGWITRLVAIRLDAPLESNYFVRAGENMVTASISAAWAPSHTEFVMADTFRRVWAYKPKEYKGSEAAIPFNSGGKEFDSAVKKVVRVGTTVFAIGSPFRIYKRTARETWEEIISIPIPAPFFGDDRKELIKAATECTFFDMAGFSETDIYAVGDVGTVWHFNGSNWTHLPFPTNVQLNTVACGDNGEVYITDIRGNLWKGSRSRWVLVCELNLSMGFADSAWYAGRLWCANDNGMYVLEGNKLVRAHQARKDPVPTDVAFHSHRIDVSPDGKRMLVCGLDGAAMLDENGWKILFSGMDLE